MKEGAAPGPNGFTMDFFKKNWRFVGDEVIAAIKFCFIHQVLQLD